MVVNLVIRIYRKVKIIKAKGTYYEDGVSFYFSFDVAFFKDKTKCNAKCIAVKI
jgi:hypothetical protein